MFRKYPDVVSVDQLCKMLGIGKNKAYQLLKNGDIRSVRIGRVIRIPKAEIIAFINQKDKQ